MSKIPDALAVLDDVIRAATFYCDREGVKSRSPFADKMLSDANKARAAFAELIEADREYDESRKINDALRDGVSTLGEVANSDWRLDAAIERRVAALAAVEKL